ncbi:MAG: NADP-dependent malic enzyme [Cytophagia bacterium]|nr:NADP-dependent malic enzyme [Bacteroidota bacterium]MBT5529812.1 NADP-dependent malic enzyme [Cytophagia bacterium]MBT7995335.1 NADP-dependent malic enzyme [Bacteroidota bacterium]
MAKQFTTQEALDYHALGRPGKIEVVPTKSHCCQKDLSLAYSPGVADPCMEIHRNKEDVYKYTAKGNLVAVISDGTAVLGLGDIGPLASKPVMEGKGLLFKIFSDIDVFDIEVDTTDIDKFVETCKLISPTFGGINLEDIKAPECFEIEERLKKELDIPVMHDDQHGTAIISGAALINAAEIVGKKMSDLKIIVNGAGAAAISCSRLYVSLGAKQENVIMLDSKGVISKKRTDLNKYKKEFAVETDLQTLEEAVKDADVFIGLSKGNILSKDMVKSMAFDPIIFAMANPNPEISYEDAIEARKSLIMATGRSDYPNQVNNVLGFPFIFRGAMDVMATCINEEMKLAAAYALADLARQPVPEEVNIAYNVKNLTFGREYIIPKPFDPRLITHISMAVAKAAMESGVAKKPIENWETYQEQLSRRLGKKSAFIRNMKSRARNNPRRVVFAEADKYKILKAAEIVYNDGIATPILLGDIDRIKALIKEYSLEINGDIEIIDPRSPEESERRKEFAAHYSEKRKRRGENYQTTKDRMRHRNYFGPMMVERGYADAMISGLTTPYPETIRPALEIIGKKKGSKIVSGMYIMVTDKGPVFFADTTINMNPDVDSLVEITLQTAEKVGLYNVIPKIALLSYSNFGSTKGRVPEMVREAVKKLHNDYPDLIVDGEMQANFAMNNELMKEFFPFSKLIDQDVNVLIFPYLSAGNIAYKLVQEMSHNEAIGPVLNGLRKSVHILQMGSSVQEIVNMVTIAVIDAQYNED